jgi:hypothetical protein
MVDVVVGVAMMAGVEDPGERVGQHAQRAQPDRARDDPEDHDANAERHSRT